MTVSSTQSYVEYNGDGTTKTFTIPFYFLLNSDIGVMVADANGNVIDLINGSNFTAKGAGVSSGGSVILNIAYAVGYSILVYRNPPATQETKYYENGKFPALSHETALDKLTMLIQDFGWQFDSLALRRPNIFASFYDAKNRRITNLADPTSPGDAVNKKYADSAISGSVAAEAAARIAADNEIRGLLDDEVESRISGDKQLQESISNEASARQEADANIQAQLTGNVPLEASAFSPISWHGQSINNSVTIPANMNAWSFGPTMTISPGQSVTVSSGSFWTIANGQTQES